MKQNNVIKNLSLLSLINELKNWKGKNLQKIVFDQLCWRTALVRAAILVAHVAVKGNHMLQLNTDIYAIVW